MKFHDFNEFLVFVIVTVLKTVNYFRFAKNKRFVAETKFFKYFVLFRIYFYPDFTKMSNQIN